MLPVVVLLGVLVFETALSARAETTVGETKFAVDDIMIRPQSVVAYIEPWIMGTEKLYLEFYAFPLSDQEIAQAAQGDDSLIKQKLYEGDDEAYNHSNAFLILTVTDDHQTIYQADIAIPGYTCTVAMYTDKAPDFAETFHLDGKTVSLVSKGSYSCFNDKHKFFWDVDMSGPVVIRE